MKFPIFNFQFPNKLKGFTLIELLIVISVIGVLTTLISANFIGVRERSRDAQRKTDLRQIQTALEFYRADIQSYPSSSAFAAIACGGTFSHPSGTTYIQRMPCDPLTNTRYSYSYTSPTYTLWTCLENERDAQRDTNNGLPNRAPCNASTNPSHTVQNP